MIINCVNYRDYPRIYTTLPLRRFNRSKDHAYSHEYPEKDDGFVWFISKNHFRLEENVYLHDALFTWLDPVAGYWMRKYRRWFKENINIEYLPEHTAGSFSYTGKMRAEQEFSSPHSYDSYLRKYYAGIALPFLVNKNEPTEEIVKKVVELSSKLVAELRHKEKRVTNDQVIFDEAEI